MSGHRLRNSLIAALGASSLAALAMGFWIPAKAELAQVLLERAWAEVLAGDSTARPWPWADTSPVAQLSIPELDAEWIVLSGASGRNLAFGPAHLDGSATPGTRGVSVIAGHRDTHFAVLQRLEKGHQIELRDRHGSRSHYVVTGTEIVDANEVRINLNADASVLVLSTCYPFDAISAGGPLRYLVFASQAP